MFSPSLTYYEFFTIAIAIIRYQPYDMSIHHENQGDNKAVSGSKI